MSHEVALIDKIMILYTVRFSYVTGAYFWLSVALVEETLIFHTHAPLFPFLLKWKQVD